MLSDINNDPLSNLDRCSLNELISILQNVAQDPTVDTTQSNFGSCTRQATIEHLVSMIPDVHPLSVHLQNNACTKLYIDGYKDQEKSGQKRNGFPKRHAPNCVKRAGV